MIRRTALVAAAFSLLAAVVEPVGGVFPYVAGGGSLAAQESAEPRPVPPEDFGRWEILAGSTLSPGGTWVASYVRRVNDEHELRIRPVDDPDSVVVVPFGGGPEFSSDGAWLAYRIGTGEEERERLQEAGEPVRDDLGILDLRVGAVDTVSAVASFAFSEDGRYLAMKRYAPTGEREATGTDLVVRTMATGVDVTLGNVAEHAWQDELPLLAMVVDAEGRVGNGVYLWEADTGRLRPLETSSARYEALTWREEAEDLAVLRAVEEGAAADGEAADRWADTARVALAFVGVESASAPHVLDPATTAGFPPGTRVVPWEELRWSEDGRILFLGVQERTPAEACAEEEAGGEDDGSAEDEEGGDGEDAAPDAEPEDGGSDVVDPACADPEDVPTVEIWHAGDVDIVPTQKVRAGVDRRENHLVAWHVGGPVVRLEDELTEEVRLVAGAPYVVGTDQTPYERDRMFGPVYDDVYLIDLETGEKEQVATRLQYFYGASPGGRYLLWLERDDYWTYDVESGERRNVTEGLPTSFVDLEDDHTVEQKPPFFYAGWLEGDEAILVYDEHDVWRIDPAGAGGERITAGAEENLRHRVVRPDERSSFGIDPDPIDPDEPIWFSLYDDWEERWGYARADRVGAEVRRLLLEPARIGGLEKAEEADVYAWVVQDFEDSPDLFVGGSDLRGRQITRTNPFQDDYLWGRSELIEYVNAHGDTLQGSLYYPAGYEEGERYPMITYIYEIRSSAVRSYDVPSEEDYYNFQTWVQDGYFVFQPDIVYRDRNPGLSAVENIEPAVEAVLATGMVDPERIGLIGHSWGGYQTTFFVTQSDLFTAAVAGAPLTNLFSMYLSVYWNSGGTDARIFEISQGRMEVPFWEDEAAYRANSPVFHIEAMKTPLLMMQGTDDGAVDFNQGVEFYNAARRAGKDFVFLVYNDENHGLAKEPNRLDYHRRINEWFGHYLKGEPAPEWMTEGVPYLEQPGGKKGG